MFWGVFIGLKILKFTQKAHVFFPGYCYTVSMRNRLLKEYLCFLLLGTAIHANAQFIPAWTRQLTPTLWKGFTSQTIFKAGGEAPFIKFSRTPSITPLVKSTDKKFIYHKVAYSGVFSKKEKELLLKPVYPQATLGTMAYLHDKHAAFFNTLHSQQPQSVNNASFWKHQNTLELVLDGLETHYLTANRKRFSSFIFSEEEIARLQAPPAQLPIYVLTPKELMHFASLPTLAAQQQWVQQGIDYLQVQLRTLLRKDTFTLRPYEFAQYYEQNIRLEYFKTLAQTLARTEQKRPSAILRLRRPLAGQTKLLTDAQRAGYLQFMADTTGTPTFFDEIKSFNVQYGRYAVAEALKAPYEWALQYGMYAPELLGMEEGTRLRKLEPQPCLDELLPKIIQLKEQLENLRKNATPSVEYYTSYYQLHAKLQIYETLVMRAQTMLNLKHE